MASDSSFYFFLFAVILLASGCALRSYPFIQSLAMQSNLLFFTDCAEYDKIEWWFGAHITWWRVHLNLYFFESSLRSLLSCWCLGTASAVYRKSCRNYLKSKWLGKAYILFANHWFKWAHRSILILTENKNASHVPANKIQFHEIVWQDNERLYVGGMFWTENAIMKRFVCENCGRRTLRASLRCPDNGGWLYENVATWQKCHYFGLYWIFHMSRITCSTVCTYSLRPNE